eukprot:5167342-Pyramimonas_sp.AAC.1
MLRRVTAVDDELEGECDDVRRRSATGATTFDGGCDDAKVVPADFYTGPASVLLVSESIWLGPTDCRRPIRWHCRFSACACRLDVR